ncbi:argininosuccinate lyase [Bacillus sp. 03113]|uniref:argininosuccinate lyase n=1 Tax=Bacillus sp. 03113 TaxID=2578211 RepID=UPI00215C22FA|nr:argininosuccinate lyase [Bacillus sp. 03113]
MIDKDLFVKDEGETFPGKTFKQELLKPIFYDQRDFLFDAMFSLHKSHVIMLLEQGILEEKEARKILEGVIGLTKLNKNELTYDPNYEDLFFLVEAKLGEMVGHEMAGKMHIARSRNDMGEGMYRVIIRKHILTIINYVNDLSDALIEQAENHIETIMPAHTHTQPAQPTTLGHYLMAIFDNLQRDQERLWNAFYTVNQSPLGAVAITTTGFPINRSRVAELLGFNGLIENSYDAIATGDYLLESAQAIVSLMVNMGRWIQEFLRFSTHEVGLLVVADPYVQISSIMPQKRNPVSIEHSRALASSSVGEAMAVIHMLHNTPYGDIVDTEDDLQPHIYKSYQKGTRVLKLMYAVIRTMKVNVEHIANDARKHLITITEMADVLTREHGLSFRQSHHIASKISKQSLVKNRELYEWPLEEINEILSDHGIQLSKDEWESITDPRIFVQRRSICGGPSPKEVRRMIEERKIVMMNKRKKYAEISSGLEQTEKMLDHLVDSLIN